MKILLVIKNTANLRTIAPVVRLLADRGNDVRIACRDIKSTESNELLQDLVSGSSRIALVKHPFYRAAGWSELAGSLRRTIDVLRYHEPVYRETPKLRARAESEAPAAARRLARLVARVPGAPGAARRALEAVERCLEPPPRAISFLQEERPDVLMITPLIGFGTSQADLVRGAQRLGIPVCFPVRSWDNLTNKGLLREPPDLVLVWNDLQAREAVDLHRVPADRVVVTGAPAYDHWFDWRPSRSREELCAAAGLDPARPIVLYAASSDFIAPDEPAFVRSWVEAVRARGGTLADAGLLVRPHPLGASGFPDLRFDDPQVSVWPRYGELPLGDSARQNYFDSIFHSDAVVGINTSAQIEAAIVGRPVYTVLDDAFAETQHGTIHFRYLVDPEFGHVHAAQTLAEHANELERALREGAGSDPNERFLLRFVRPFGLAAAATPLAADAIEQLGRRPGSAKREPVLAPAVRLGLRPLASRAAERKRRQKQGAERADDLKHLAKRLVRASGGNPIVAGPWVGDETGELLYWIPFLRWAAAANAEVAARLVTVARPEVADRYAGLPGRLVTEAPDEGVRLDPALVEQARHDLSQQDPFVRLHRRTLEFARLPADARSEPYAGPFGPESVVALLSGVDAYVPSAEGHEDEVALASRLARGPAGFGRLHVGVREPVHA